MLQKEKEQRKERKHLRGINNNSESFEDWSSLTQDRFVFNDHNFKQCQKL